MSTRRARVIPRVEAGGATLVGGIRVAPERVGPPLGRVMSRPVAEARVEAEVLLESAREEAQQILSRAEAAARDLIVQQQARARADALCLVVGEALELRKRQAELSRNVLERSIGFATLLAERLLGAELEQKPEQIRALARQALKEAAGARQAIVVAHPRDASELRADLAGLGSLLDSIDVAEDDTLKRGHIRVETELGVIEADLRGQLDRLAAQLKKLLTSHAPDTG